jgi:sarcosine oxidase
VKTFDVAVLGVGGIGSAACYHLARAGLRVLGIEQFSIPHSRGSSHGVTRILRQGLHENEAYVPLVRRALELWGELEKTGGTQLFYRTGSLDIGLPKSAIVTRSLNACQRWSISHDSSPRTSCGVAILSCDRMMKWSEFFSRAQDLF